MAYENDEACNKLGLRKNAYPIGIKDLGVYKGVWKNLAVNGAWCGVYHSPIPLIIGTLNQTVPISSREIRLPNPFRNSMKCALSQEESSLQVHRPEQRIE